MADPLESLAETHMLARLRADRLDILLQFDKRNGGRPLVTILLQAKSRAAAALVSLADVDPEEPKIIRKLQKAVEKPILAIEAVIGHDCSSARRQSRRSKTPRPQDQRTA